MPGQKVGAVLVVGGGIAGIQASLDLAEQGFKVYLLDRAPAIGGVMSQLDKTFPTNDCATCILAPKLVEAGRHPNITLITNAEVVGLDGEPGNFKVRVRIKPRYIDPEKCTGCGLCAEKCPVEAIDEFNQGLSPRSAIFIRYPQAVPRVFMIDRDKCIGCGTCSEVCRAGAVFYEDEERVVELNVGAVILAPGFQPLAPRALTEFGYGRYPNVVTSIEFERILSASGPFGGLLVRPSDGEIPRRIAFIQCVGSRDERLGVPYCSSVCCMYSIKQAVIAREHAPIDVECTIFYMDMRTYGKGFEAYMNRAEEEYGVRFVKCRVPRLYEDTKTHNLIIRYLDEETGTIKEEEFDLVVLAVGFRPPEGAEELAKALGVELNEFGFCKTSEFNPLETSRPGVFVCGAFSGPKDIPDSVAEASGAAAKAASLISSERGKLVAKKEYPPEIEVRPDEEPRIGVFICHCGVNIGGIINVKEVVEYAKTLPGVVYAEDNLYTCSQDTQERIKEAIREHKLNRVVVASCTPRTHEPLFRETLREAGLNPYLFEMANIRDQCSWVHMHEPEKATEKAKDLVRSAVAKARLLRPLERPKIPVTPAALVIGGGVSGMTAALELARQGFDVFLVEREEELGGHLRHIYYSLNGEDPQEFLKRLIQAVETNPRIKVFKGAEVVEVSGYVGNFETTIRQGSVEETVKHGVIIVATGAEVLKPYGQYLYGEDPRVLTQMELEERLAKGDFKAERVVMIQCVGSRVPERPYCSRICCYEAVKNALKIKELCPGAEVLVLFRDVRTYGFRELYYREAREKGVVFARYTLERPPEVLREGDKLLVRFYDPATRSEVVTEADYVVLSTAIVPRPDAADLAKMLKVPLSQDGFFLEAHVKLRPLDFASDGIFLCGMAHYPKFIDECVAQACGAAARAATILSKPYLEVEAAVASVDTARCRGCGRCEEVCEYGAISVVEEDGRLVAKVNEALCKGCGACSVRCPTGAVRVKHFKPEQILAQVLAVAMA